ncbi:T9SS type A sorting domain-containing protein [Thermoflexibacter ruber]|uniref:Por secretion system C-terminal sorting domain-containing protein n=1 Tax=Thermoflexibacter ruber TaxID=1003 RepID=A0A1I2G1N2_9BACT|nr:T9SS type A sorting domain-containing protein [Thermoflexibacter ruber]SFF11452.1 Por secretion system C-terminal sorting domain-containing protein [Thermoflexibacter ruber]
MKKLIFSSLLLLISCWALAQFNVNISAGATANVTITNAGTVRTFTANAVGANVQIADIIAAYTGGVTEVRILTGTTGGSENGNITLSNAIDYNGIGLGKTLTLIAHSNISIINPITDGMVGGDLLNLNLTGNGTLPTGTNAGVRITTTVITNGGNITIVGTQSAPGAKGVDIPSGTILTGGGFLNITGTANGVNAGVNTCDGIDIQSTSTNTNGGAIVLNGTSSNINGNNGVQIDSPLNSGTGAISITGVSNGNATGVVNTLGSITTTSGSVTITGTANSTLLTAVPQVFASGVSIVQPITTGSGNINIVGTSAANAPAFFNATAIGNGTVTSASGNITIQGTNTNNNVAATLALGIRILQAITTTSGKLTFTAQTNANASAFSLGFVTAPIASSGSITSTSGELTIVGKANNTSGGRGVLTERPINVGAGKITITGENSGNAEAVLITSTLTSSNDITLNGLAKLVGGIFFNDAILIGATANVFSTGGKITLNGECLGSGSGVTNFSSISNTTGDIIINGITRGTNNFGRGITMVAPLVTTTGKISLTGYSDNFFPGIATFAAITTSGGDVTLDGKATNPTVTGGALPFGTEIQQPINTGAGKITIKGENNAGVPACIIWQSASLTTTSGNIEITGFAKSISGIGRAVDIRVPITTGSGNVSIIGESDSDYPGSSLFSSITSTSGSFFLKGINKNTTTNSTVAYGIEFFSSITTGGNGSITIQGENNANASAVYSLSSASISTVNGNIHVKGLNKNVSNTNFLSFGVLIGGNVNITGSGSIVLEGENSSNIAAIRVTGATPIATNTGNILIKGKNNNTAASGAIGVGISQPLQSALGSISIEGESNSPGTSIGITSPISTTIGNILIKGQAKNTTTMNGSGIIIASPISSTQGNITIEGEINAGNTASAIETFIGGTGSIISTSGNIFLKGIAKGTGRKGITISKNITSQTGKITLMGESEGAGGSDSWGINLLSDGTQAIATTGNGGDITLNGIVKNADGGKGVALMNMPITTTTGKINITGETAGQADAVHIDFNSGLVSTGGDISIDGKCTNPISGAGVRANGAINAGSGKITIIGENNADNIEAVRVANALNNTNADISISGRAKNPNNTVAGVRITAPINASRHLNIIGASPNNGILSLQRLQAVGNINLLTERGGLRVEDVIQSIAGGSIDICVAVGGNLAVTGVAGGLSISTTNNANINITNGTGTLSVGNPMANVRGLIANGGNIVPEGVYPNTIFGNIRIKGSVGIQTFNPLFTTNLNGFTFILNLDACVPMVKWASTLTTANFDIANFPTGTSIRSVSRLNDTQVRIVMNFTGDDIDFDFPLAQLIAKASAFTPLSNDVAFATPVRASQILAPVIRGRAGSQSIRLEWASVTGAVNYEVYSLTAGQAQQLIGTTSDTVFTVTGLRNATTYFFKVIAVSKNGFKSDFSNTVELRPSIILGTDEETENRIFKVYPNPSNGNFYLQANELKGKNATLTITDLSGRVIYQRNWQIVGSMESQVELNLAEGIYLLQLDTEKENFKRKLLIER